MKFSRYSLQETITVKHLISFHYFEYAKGFVFEGEQHDFWEFLYVDKGEVEVRADERTLELKQGSLIVHKPNEFHTVRVRQEHKPPNLIVISFECASPALKALGGRVMNVGDRERNWLSLLLQEGFQAFKAPFDKPNDHTLVRRKEAAFGSEHLIKLYLEALLIHLCRSEASADSREPKLSLLPKERSEEQLVQQITDFMRRDLSRPLTLEQLAKGFHLGKTRLKELFQSQTGTGVLEYYRGLRIEQAKLLIRERQSNFTEIAQELGYGSIHYFSRDFRKLTGMSPSEYAKSVMARI